MAQILYRGAGFDGDGEVGATLRAFDWHASPLGDPQQWPGALKTAVNMMLNSSFPMFVAWGPELIFLYNDAYAPILGAKHPGALGTPFQDVWSEIWHDLVPIVDRALSDKSAYFEDLPLLMLRKGFPEQTWFTFSYSPLHDGDGRVGGMFCTCIETTARVQTERRQAFELRVSDALRPLTSPADVIATASALLGEEIGVGRVLYGEVDDARGTLFVPRDWVRAPMHSVAGQTFRLDQLGPALLQAMRAGDIVTVDDTAADPRTRARHASIAATGVRALLAVPLVKSGRLLAMLSLHRAEPYTWSDSDLRLAREMAERTWAAVENARAQADLRNERDRSRYIFDTVAEGFALFDRDWTVLEMNAEGLKLSQRSAAQAIGRNHWEVWPEVLGTELEAMLREAMDSGVPGTAEFVHHLPEGRVLWMEVRAYRSSDGGLASFFRDITYRKLSEQKLKAADQRKDEFLAMLAHELRNPLAPISAAAELLKIGKLDEARVRQSSAIIGRQVRHMTSLVDDLLDVSRVTRGLVSLASAPVDVRGVVEEAIEQARPLINARGQQLGLSLPDEAVLVLGDKARLVQVIVNLLNNAAKYTPENKRIDVHAQVEGQQLILSVRDEGIGMEPELTGRVFELFAQAERSSDRSLGGLGLGLALVKHLVELHGGVVACSSGGAGCGSTFVVTLPLVTGQAASAAAAADGDPGAQSASLKLMVVDDNVDAADTLGMLLEACGHEVAVEHSSRGALLRARGERLDACLLDIGLPDMDGNELARQLRSAPATAGLVLIAVTGYGQERDRSAAFDAGFDHHLVKPVDLDKLAALLGGITAARTALAAR
jgi:PAS domain S-box-containing protein